MDYLSNAREIFERFDSNGNGTISTKLFVEIIDIIDPDKIFDIKEKDLIEFGDPTFFGHVTFNYFIQAISQCVIIFNEKEISILKYINKISD